jgi:hypothetical protein
MNSVNLETRVRNLEGRVNRYRLTIALLGLALLAVVCIAAEAPKGVTDELRTKKLVIVDEQGKQVVLLASGKFGGVLRLMDAPGQTLVIAGASETGGRLMVADNMGSELVKINADEGGGQMVLLNKKGQKQVLTSSATK